MRRYTVCALALAVSGLSSSRVTASQDLVANGSFEEPFIGDGGGGGFVTFGVGWPMTFDPWVVDAGTMDVVADAGIFAWQQVHGHQSLDLTGSPEPGSIYQDLATTPGQMYRLRFAMAGNPVVNIPPLKAMDLYWGQTLVSHQTFDVTGHTEFDLGWQYVQFFVTAPSDTTRLRFTSRTPDAGGIVIDDVSVVAVPEPTTVAVLLAGALLRTRRRTSCM